MKGWVEIYEIKRSYQNFPFRFAYLYRKITQFYTKKLILDVQEALNNLEKYKLKCKDRGSKSIIEILNNQIELQKHEDH